MHLKASRSGRSMFFLRSDFATLLRHSFELLETKTTRLPFAMSSLIILTTPCSSPTSEPPRRSTLPFCVRRRTLVTTPPMLKMKVCALWNSWAWNSWSCAGVAESGVPDAERSPSGLYSGILRTVGACSHPASMSAKGLRSESTRYSLFSLRQALPMCMSEDSKLKPLPRTACTCWRSSVNTVLTQEPSVSCRPTSACGNSSLSWFVLRVKPCAEPSASTPFTTKRSPSTRTTLATVPRMFAGLNSLSARGHE
mmetsp:Transcript_72918/g.201251  ORF Transcript_72918/g.201251 Transcript_72918/m.201251 type:complete len:253 (+) Transcript_72918:836-1594(+)